jgi:GntR family transcriptional regulator
MTGARFRSIADDVRERIALGDLGDSGALESEAALGQRYGASRVTVRRALELLREQGLVESRQGSGWFVAGGSFHQTLALGTFRHASSAVAESGRRLSRRVVSFAYETPPAAVGASLQLAAGEEALHSRSVRTVDDVPLDLVQEWVPAALAGRLSRADATDPGIWQSLQRNGHRVTSVRQSITAGVATEQDATLLGVDPGTALLLVRRVALAREVGAIALSDHRYLAHRFSLEVEFNGWPTADEPPGLRTVPDPT